MRDQSQIRLKDSTWLKGASYHAGYDLRVESAGGCDDRLWLFGREFGPEMVIVARSFGEAWEAVLNALPAIPEAEVPKAYGFDSEADLEAAFANAQKGIGAFPELVADYEYQTNANGSGIVKVDDYAWLRPLTKQVIRGWRIKLEITADF